MSKKYDIVIHGATGFTGSLVVKYLSKMADIKVAVSGRSLPKLQAVLKESKAEHFDVIIADSFDKPALASMVQQTNVVLSLVGPYLLYGSDLVEACVAHGTHYVDLTGEACWVAKMIDQHGAAAVASKAIMIHSTGFDSVPSDINAFLAVQALKKKTANVGQVTSVFSAKGGLSGGTIASGLSVMNCSPEDKKAQMNPFSLSPIPGNHVPSPIIAASSTFRGKKTWGGFFIMAPHNEAIVRRSWGVLESASASSQVLAYGPKFQYREMMAMPNPVVAALFSVVIYLVGASLFVFAPLRNLVGRYAAQPGEGPSVDAQAKGSFKCVTVANSVDGKHQVQVTMRGKSDPGYSGTAKMISECALAIVKDFKRLPVMAQQGGFLTPATGLGNVLVDRLQATGQFSFVIDDGKTE